MYVLYMYEGKYTVFTYMQGHVHTYVRIYVCMQIRSYTEAEDLMIKVHSTYTVFSPEVSIGTLNMYVRTYVRTYVRAYARTCKRTSSYYYT